jgi:CO/xanthine dehydrogenase Mo-binding subunit
MPMDVGAPAVISAIHDACGVWIEQLPATPEKILASLTGSSAETAPDGRPS